MSELVDLATLSALVVAHLHAHGPKSKGNLGRALGAESKPPRTSHFDVAFVLDALIDADVVRRSGNGKSHHYRLTLGKL